MPIPQAINKYQVIKELGSGHFGEVLHAFDRALKADKAIKVLNVTDPNQFVARLEEAQLLQRCAHKHIVAINEANVFPVNGHPRVVLDLEYVPEGSLEAAMAVRWVSIQEAVSYIRGALLGLEHAHDNGILHRDIKPGNILLSPKCAKLSDFGLATAVAANQVGSAQGYTTHLAPEFYRTQATSALTDVFAMGITLFRVLGNIADWSAVTNAIPKKLEKIRQGKLVPTVGYPEFVPAALRRIVNKACHADPAKRYQSANEFGQKLDALRFGIDWIRNSDLSWSGSSGNVEYTAQVDLSRNSLVVKKNGRRQTSLCGVFDSVDEAAVGLHRHIAESTLAK